MQSRNSGNEEILFHSTLHQNAQSKNMITFLIHKATFFIKEKIFYQNSKNEFLIHHLGEVSRLLGTKMYKYKSLLEA